MTLDSPTIPHLMLRSAERFGDRPAIVPVEGPAWSFAELATQMRRAAAAFMAAGIAVGDRIALWAPNRPEWIAATLGLQAAGAVLVPLNTRYKGAEAGYILQASGARMLLTVRDFLGNDYAAMIADARPDSLERIVFLDDWADFLDSGADISDAEVSARIDSLNADDICDILFTSGTTGKPKGVVTTHGQNLAVYDVYSAGLTYGEGDRLLAVNPWFHSFGYKAGWLCAIMRGCTLYPMLSFDPAEALNIIEAERITLLPGPPTIYQSLLALDLRGRNIGSLRVAVTGATIVPAPLIRDMKDILGFDRVFTAYGLTETCGTVTMCAADDDIDTISTTSGRAIPGVEVKVVDGAGTLVPAGEQGDIWVRGFNVMRGYFDNPAATADVIDADGWLKTGDVGMLRADGCLSITDRSKDVFICGGFNIYPAEVEQMLARHLHVFEASVVSMADDRLGEVGRAFVVLRPGSVEADVGGADGLIGWARDQMANFKVPRAVHFRESLPRNASGKVEKYKLKAEAE